MKSKPLWAAVFGTLFIGEVGGWRSQRNRRMGEPVSGTLFVGETLTSSDAAGGALIIAACLVNAADPQLLRGAAARAGAAREQAQP